MSTNAQEKEAAKVAIWLEWLASEADARPEVQLTGSSRDLAKQLRGLAQKIREGWHRG